MPSNPPSNKIKVLFVCLGNICRSPLAEGVFRHLVRERGLEDRFDIDSAGTGSWHVGEPPDRRMRETARRHGVPLDGQRARQFTARDLEHYDHIFVMDRDNLHDVLFLDREDRYGNKVRLFREFDPEPGDYQVPDPYYGGAQGFENVFAIVERTARTLLDRLVAEYDLDQTTA
ncbi:low molecular weight phosphotyrosine protein phosphatase [Rhodocaloribacter litoris]|uniref:low molecular weight protein-tyrosine-phosphatase n=1 Tax=Rhodocaloribacter litoris TaxID=2558931 RepID=UPI00141F2035|nr:low molecular weight protein-tyrosine-phosphatase [Rhodocaloribacter litoris]QXD14844.1 low molecular weight phosphotyrosine protein phosphatase [Rhodocaloribacter litoris]GIV59060.1 MAG: protein-tyrosine-phosphatase [Rhodothermaceae bacterium]